MPKNNCKFEKCSSKDIRAYGLCHKHYELYRRSKKRLLRHQKRLNNMLKVIEIVEGKKDLKIDISGTMNNINET